MREENIMYRKFFVPFKMTINNLLGYLGEEYTNAKKISIRHNIPLKQVMDIKNIRYWQSNFHFEDGRVEHLHGQLIYVDEHEVIIKIAFKFNTNKGYEQLTTRATINDYQNASYELRHSNVTHEYYDANKYNDTIITKWLTRNLYINRAQLINIEFLAKTAKNRSQENDDKLNKLIDKLACQYQANLRIKENKRKREIERKRQREAKRKIRHDLWYKRYVAWISRQNYKKQIRENEYQKRHAEREAKKQRLLLMKLKQDLYQIKAKKARIDYYQKQHEIRLRKRKSQVLYLLWLDLKQISQRKHRKQIRDDQYKKSHDERYARRHRDLLKKITIKISGYENELERQKWLAEQKKNLIDFPWETVCQSIDFDNRNLLHKANNYKLIYLMLGYDKQNKLIGKVGRTNNLEAREGLYNKTVDFKNNLFNKNQKIIVLDYYLDIDRNWTKSEFYSIEKLFIKRLELNNCIQKPREWLYAKTKMQRQRMLNDFKQTKKLLSNHPELLLYFRKRGTNKALYDLKNHSLRWLIEKANEN